MTFSPPKPWNPERFRSVITSLEDKTLVDQTAIPWCTTHDHHVDTTGLIGCDYLTTIDQCEPITDRCVVSTGPPDHKWWKDI